MRVPLPRAARNRFFLYFPCAGRKMTGSRMNTPLLRCRDLHCSRPLWREGASNVRGINADFPPARFHVLCGPAGCGKNLLAHLLGLLEKPDRGEIWLGDVDATALDVSARDALRQRNFGFLFPACALLPSLSVLENIAFPVLKAGGCSDAEQADRTLSALQFCGLEDAADLPPSRLSQERGAIASFARAIVHRPAVLIAESPAAEEILVPLARRAVDELRLTVVWVTHPGSPACVAADRVLAMDDGKIAAREQ